MSDRPISDSEGPAAKGAATSLSPLDRQYNLRPAYPEREQIYRDYAERSAAMRDRLDCTTDVRYGEGPREVLDIFPASSGGPVLVFIHGGYWRALDKSIFSFIAESFVARGVTTVLLNYQLAPASELDRIVSGAMSGIAWVARHISGYGGDPSRIHVAGHSAGGHLTAMATLNDWAAHGLDADLVRGAVAISGLFDLEPLCETTINREIRMDRACARRNSPIRFDTRRSAPMLLAVGELETDEFRRQTAAFAEARRAVGQPCETMTVPDAHHFSIVEEFARPGAPLHEGAWRLLSRDPAGA